MPEKYRVIYTRQVADQIREIVEYIARSSPENAARMAERMVKAIDSLELLPHRFSIVRNPDAVGEPVRSMLVRPYLIRYQVNERLLTVTVVSIRHGARRPEP